VNASTIVEFLDPDGGYVRALPLDEVRCRVLRSNLARRGEVFLKDPGLDWEEATQDLGGWTRVGPSDLVLFGEAVGSRKIDLRALEGIPDRVPPAAGDLEEARALLGRLVRGTQALTGTAAAELLALPLPEKKRRLLRRILRRIRKKNARELGAA
jgi:hypothetical protein